MIKSPDRTFQRAAREALTAQIDLAAERNSLSGTTGSALTRRGDMVRLSAVAAVLVGTVTVSAVAVVAAGHNSKSVPAGQSTPTTHISAPDPSTAFAESLRQVKGIGRISGPISGNFTITYDSGSPVLNLSQLNASASKARQIVLSVDLASAKCHGNRAGTLAGTISEEPTQTDSLLDSSPQEVSDLSYMNAIAIWPGPTGTDCISDQVSAGKITWSLPATVKNLARTDEGSKDGASGEVEIEGGRPTRYTVAPNDQLADVATRFNLTQTELLYLNPLRSRGSNSELFVDEVLNLDPTDRGGLY